MTRRSFFVFAAVFMTILMAFSFALATDTVTVANNDNSLRAGLYGGSTLSDKITGTHSKDGEWDIFTFTINSPLAESDWKKTDTHYPDGLFDIRVEIKAPDNAERCKRYYPDNTVGNETIIEGGYISIQNALPKGDHIGMRSFDLKLEWLNGSDEIFQTTYPKIRCIIIDDSAPKPVPQNRINAGMDSALKRDGAVVYPYGQSASVAITAPNGAAYYSLNNSTDKTAVTNGTASIASAEGAAYTINWYGGETGESFIKAETLSVSFYYEPVPVSWLNMGFSDKWENVTTTVPQYDGNITGDLVFEFNLTDAQWQELLYNSVDSQYLHWPFEIKLPEEAAELSNVGTYYKNEEGIDFILVANYFESYDVIGWPIEIANVSTDGNKAIVTPKNFDGTYLFKWKAENGVEHFHQINFQIKHASEAAVVVDSVEPGKSRIAFNVGKLDGVTYEYQDGVVTYSINEEPESPAEIITTVERPDADVVQVKVINTMNGQSAIHNLDETHTAAVLGIPAHEGQEGMITYKLEWLNSNGGLESSDLITVKVLPIYAGVWMDKYWAPVGDAGLVEDNGLSEHLTYKNGGWTFKVDPTSKNTLDVERLSTNERLIYIPVPDGAEYFRMTSGESSLYWYDGADGDKEFLEKGMLIPIKDADGETSMRLVEVNGQRALAAHFGSIFTKSSFKDGNLDVYVVNDDVTGHATYRIIEWFNKDREQLMFGENNDKCGHYIYMEKKPYMQTAETELEFDKYASVTPKPGEAYAIVWECDADKQDELKGLKFRCEVPLQKDTHENHKYVYQKLDLIDADGNVVELPAGTTIKVVLPYPEGLNKSNTKLEFFDVWHYEDESHGKHESMCKNGSLAMEDIGITFITDSFSPFLLSYEPRETSASSGGSGISVTYNGGNSFSTSKSAVPTSVEIDGEPVSFIGDGRSFTVSSIPAGAKWITVKWNSTSVTTNFAPDGNVVSAGIEIPKTGDISLLMPVLALIGAAAARCRRSSK